MTHTPTPWRVIQGYERSPTVGIDSDSLRITYEDAFLSEHDAAFAVRAANSHDALVEALADFVGMGEGYGWDDAHTGREILMRNARAALALAKGEAEE